MDKEDREYYREANERERVERERRDDVETERELWCNVVEICLQDGGNASIAIDKADFVLDQYRKRFS